MATRSESSPATGRIATPLAWLSRQLLLAPEAVLLLALLAIHGAIGASPVLAVLGLTCGLYFALRMALLRLSRGALEAARYRRAMRLARAAARLYPASADAQALLGAIHMARGEVGSALGALTRAVELFPLQADLHAALSAALLAMGRPGEARAAAQQALALNPRSAAAWLHLAGADEQLGAAPAQVERQLRAGLALPARPADEAALRCALTALLLAEGRAGAALPILGGVEPLLAACPVAQRAGLHFYLGELLRLLGEPEQAQGHFYASERLDPHGLHAAAAWRAARTL
jgi:tetratricopeptide (TPR) repeat protein